MAIMKNLTRTTSSSKDSSLRNSYNTSGPPQATHGFPAFQVTMDAPIAAY